MSIFAMYYMTNLLRVAGWPRKQGLLGREVYDPKMVDMATSQMIDWAASIGAGKPVRALQMMAEMLREKDWDGDSPPQIGLFLNEVRDKWGIAGAGPSDDIEGVDFAGKYKSMSVKDFTDPRIRGALETLCLDGLFWGIDRPDEYRVWYEAKAVRYSENAPLYQKMGLDVEAPPPLGELFVANAEVLDDYEVEIGALPAIPAPLLRDASALSRRIVFAP